MTEITSVSCTARSSEVTNQCATCIQNSDVEKCKPGIVPCLGCKQIFCLNHFVEHRKTLSDTLDTIVAERDQLRSHIQQISMRVPQKHLQAIDNWKREMFQKINDATINAQEQILASITDELERECTTLTEKISSFRQNDDYFESDLQSIQTKMKQLNGELIDSSAFHRVNLNLPTLDFVNMVQIEPLPTLTSSENEQSLEVAPISQYRSFIENFIATHKPPIEVKPIRSEQVCASPTMLINIQYSRITRVIFHRMSSSSFDWKDANVLDMKWSSQLEQFIVRTPKTIAVIDPMEKQITTVVRDMGVDLQHITCWKHMCLVTDSHKRILLYDITKTMTEWFLINCWSKSVFSAEKTKITAIGLNDHNIPGRTLRRPDTIVNGRKRP
ncbi:unnamed protein product [Rotaria magnacalcarata]|uniref:Uncharacterized protein n=1 Tax=Rotaria magnacalcarata TaxID=392030 RepID=A0A816LE16_9BILA|nr:unnamed protein product [Rotaria magnacalcarata]